MRLTLAADTDDRQGGIMRHRPAGECSKVCSVEASKHGIERNLGKHDNMGLGFELLQQVSQQDILGLLQGFNYS